MLNEVSQINESVKYSPRNSQAERDNLNQQSIDDTDEEVSLRKDSTIGSGGDGGAPVTQSVAIEKVPQFSFPLDRLPGEDSARGDDKGL